jgi:hypothetical protein
MEGDAFPYDGEIKKLKGLCPAIHILWNNHPPVPLSADKKGRGLFFPHHGKDHHCQEQGKDNAGDQVDA